MSEFSKRCEKIKKELEKRLSASRYAHTLQVMVTAQVLAMRYGEDIEKAGYAGLLHDCAKHLTAKEQIRTVTKAGYPIRPEEEKNPVSLLHAKAGAYLAKKEFGITDEEVLSAICYHTTGKPAMTKLEMIVFLADYMEPGRDKASNLPLIRKTVFESLEKAVYFVTRDTLDYLESTHCPIDEMTLHTFRYYETYCKQYGLL